ncbi:hypothetical protein EHP00_2607 [Ecytonucleospora hepatopenaei]|uniref:Meiotic nuclear division protein 1 n=1 Tax=Ecytonucleospora hepatopenaei TaxID=646526 RepID=A0A1W0E2D9_9MICR|nr:hypothetical protein EHP00_2607 [Ecytonucleospora hepatopenaei]
MAKRVSTEEKLQKIIEFFTSTSDVYVIKELEKKIPKQCNISAMLVKDLLTNLQNECKINVEKCGTSNYYWKFLFEKEHATQCKIEKTTDENNDLLRENKKIKDEITEMKNKRQDTEERRALVKEYTRLKTKKAELEKIKNLAGKYSKEQFEELKNVVKQYKNDINRFTDDIYTLQSHVCNKLNIDKNDFNKNFQIPEDLDYVE